MQRNTFPKSSGKKKWKSFQGFSQFKSAANLSINREADSCPNFVTTNFRQGRSKLATKLQFVRDGNLIPQRGIALRSAQFSKMGKLKNSDEIICMFFFLFLIR